MHNDQVVHNVHFIWNVRMWEASTLKKQLFSAKQYS